MLSSCPGAQRVPLIRTVIRRPGRLLLPPGSHLCYTNSSREDLWRLAIKIWLPHVFGSTPESLWYGVGYAQAQDRLWQADVLRRTAQGTSAEFFGQAAVDGDLFSRTLFGSNEGRTALLAEAPGEVRTIFNAFSAGMNA